MDDTVPVPVVPSPVIVNCLLVPVVFPGMGWLPDSGVISSSLVIPWAVSTKTKKSAEPA